MAKTRSLLGAERSPRPLSNSSQNTGAMAEASTASHLDKMGRELKCPICLSLLNQAASLTCNHVFCNACILRSIKSASVCPVCKVPCTRREVRLAPHMDSLVMIYRNMEIAAGVNLFGSQPCMSKDSRDDADKENEIPSCQSGLKRKPTVKSEGKPKRAKGCGGKPSRLSVVSSHQVKENTRTENIEQEFLAQAIPSPHQPVKHSFPTKKRVQVSLYPPGSVEETPLRLLNKLSNSEDKVSQSEGGSINGNMLLTSLDNMHFDSDSQICLQSEPKTEVIAQNSIKDAPVTDRVLLDEHGNPLLSPFFWLRDREIEEIDGTQMPNSQPTQFTQITQASPSACPSFSDLKDSDDEGYHCELQNDEHNTGITVPDTFDSEMFEWTQRPCSPELNSSPRKQQSPKEPEVIQLAPKLLEGDDALLVNGINESHKGIIPVNANGSDIERRQELDKDISNKNANAETADLPKKSSCKEKVKLLSSDEQICHERKKSGNIRPKAEAASGDALGKRKRGRKPKRSSGRNLNGEGFSHVGDSVVSRGISEPLQLLDGDDALLVNGINESHKGIIPVNANASDMERRQESDKDNSNKNANAETADLPKKPFWKEKVDLLSSDEQICQERKKSGNVRPKAEAASGDALGKRKRGRKPKRSSGRNLNGEGFSHVRDSVVSRGIGEPLQLLDGDDALLVNGINESHKGIIPVNANVSDIERRQESDKDNSNKNANAETADFPKKPFWKEKVDLLSSDEQICHERKTSGNVRPKAEAASGDALGKRKRGRKPKRSSGRNLNGEGFSHVRDSVVSRGIGEPLQLLDGDDALLVNGINESHKGIIPVNANVSDIERRQESDKDNSNKNANAETADFPKKPFWKEKVDLLSSDEQICHERKKSGNVRPKAEAASGNALGKRKRGRKPERSSDRNLGGEGFSHVRDSVVSGGTNEPLLDSDKELAFTAADIFDVMFGLPTNRPATDTAVLKIDGDTEVRDQECHLPLDISSTAQNKKHEHLALNVTQECQHGVGSIVSGGNLETTTPADTTELQPEAFGSCFRSESSTLNNEIVCVFCQTSGDSEAAGQMMYYSNGRAVTKTKEMPSNVVHVHKFCAEWAPVVYFKGDCIMNLETEVSRGIKIKCSMCGLKGAALGCCFTKCHRSFHVPCALSNSECRWDIDDYVMLCPTHSSRKFPKERKSKSLKQDSSLCTRGKRTPTEATPCRGTQSSATMLAGSEPRQRWTWPSGPSCKWVLCGSALDTAEKETLNNFANLIGATISKTWSPAVTHVIASTDANGACRRTLKFLMAILEGKWILKTDWITSCLKEGSPVPEDGFEITHDIHDTYDGPKRGRLRVEKQEPKLFEGLSFYLSGEFTASLKGYLQDLISAAGGVVLHRKPIMDHPDCLSTIVLYNVELPETNKHTEKLKGTSVRGRLKQAKSLADALGAQFAAHTWVLESIAASQLQPTSNGC